MTLVRMREIVAALRSPEGCTSEEASAFDLAEALSLLATIACIDAPDVDIDAMTERALAATPGPWRAIHVARGSIAISAPDGVPDGACLASVNGIDVWEREGTHDRNAAHIAGAHPAAVLTLLARLRRAEAALSALSPAR